MFWSAYTYVYVSVAAQLDRSRGGVAATCGQCSGPPIHMGQLRRSLTGPVTASRRRAANVLVRRIHLHMCQLQPWHTPLLSPSSTGSQPWPRSVQPRQPGGSCSLAKRRLLQSGMADAAAAAAASAAAAAAAVSAGRRLGCSGWACGGAAVAAAAFSFGGPAARLKAGPAAAWR